MSAIAGFDPAVLDVPTGYDEFLDIFAQATAPGGIRAINLHCIGVLPHGRPLEGASLDSVSALFLALTQAGDAATPPELFKVGLAARVAGVSDEDNDARVKRALVQALVSYLWRCTDRGGLKTSTAGAYLPANPTASGPSAAAASAKEAPSIEHPDIAGTKRLLDEISRGGNGWDAASAGPPSEAGESEPSRKQSLIYVSVSAKVSPMLCV